jgi:hypothetical protein
VIDSLIQAGASVDRKCDMVRTSDNLYREICVVECHLFDDVGSSSK